jgi:O-antigen ligase
VGAVVALLPSLAFQLVAVVGTAVTALSAWMASLGRVLDPVWVILAALYLLAPVGVYVATVGLGLSMAAALLIAFGPFVLAALVIRPPAREKLLLLAPLAIAAALAGLSLLWTPSPDYGAEKLNIWIVTGLAPAAYVLVLAAAARQMAWWLIVVAALLSAVGLIVFGVASPLYPGRPTLFDMNPISAARAIFLGAVVVVFIRPWGRTPAFDLVRVGMIAIMVVAGLMTRSLGPLLGFVVGSLAGIGVMLWRGDRQDRRVMLGWLVLFLGATLGVFVALSGALDTLVAPLFVDPNVTSRAGYLDASIPLFLGSPIMGIGIGGFESTGLDTYPHNLIAETAVELGLVGMLLLGAWIALALRGGMWSPMLMATVVSTGVFALFSGSLASNPEFWLLSAVAVSVLSVRRSNEAVAIARVGLRPSHASGAQATPALPAATASQAASGPSGRRPARAGGADLTAG